MKTIPKSLHTVTVLVAVARLMLDMQPGCPDAVGSALVTLGYADTPDTYELASKARAILAKQVQP